MADEEMEQAYQAVHNAIQDLLILKGWNHGEDGALMLGDFVILGTQMGYDPEGHGTESVFNIVAGGALPWHRILGVVEAGRLQIQQSFNRQGE